MGFKSILEGLKKSKEFKAWHGQNPENYLSYALKIFDKGKEEPWQLGYYNRKTDRMTSFVLDGKNIYVRNEEEIFKKPDMKVEPLYADRVGVSFDDILNVAKEFRSKEYPNEVASKTIVILQNVRELGNIWNVTYVTDSFKTLNIKVSAENGKILRHKLESLMNFVRG